MKYKDMLDELSGKNRPKDVNERELRIQLFKQVHQNLGEITIKKLAKAFGISERTAQRWLAGDNNADEEGCVNDIDSGQENNNYLIEDKKDTNEEKKDTNEDKKDTNSI